MSTAQLHNIIQQGKPIVVAYSGGMDSSVLLKKLVEMRKERAFPLYAIHIHHGLSQHADAWLNHCKKNCQDWNVTFYSACANLSPKKQQSLEALAREARYRLISDIVEAKILPVECASSVALLTGQHKDDQVETFFIRLKRGSGPKGLSAMAAQRAVNSFITLHRPLLQSTRDSLFAYAQQQKLSWVEDESNADITFDRNFLRNQVLPLLNQRWQGFKDCVVRSAELAAEYTAIVEEVAQNDLQSVQIKPAQLCCNRFITLSENRQRAVLRYWLQQLNCQLPSQKQLQAIQNEVIQARDDSQALVKLKQGCLRKYRQKLYFTPTSENITSKINEPIVWSLDQSSTELNIPAYQQILSCRLAKELAHDNDISSLPLLIVRPARTDEVVSVHYNPKGSLLCLPNGRGKQRSIKKLLHEYEVPYWERHRIPFIFYNDELVAAVGLWACSAFQAEIEHGVVYQL